MPLKLVLLVGIIVVSALQIHDAHGWGKLKFLLLIAVGLLLVVRTVQQRNKRNTENQPSSLSNTPGMSKLSDQDITTVVLAESIIDNMVDPPPGS